MVKALSYYSEGLGIDPEATDGTMCPGVDSATKLSTGILLGVKTAGA